MPGLGFRLTAKGRWKLIYSAAEAKVAVRGSMDRIIWSPLKLTAWTVVRMRYCRRMGTSCFAFLRKTLARGSITFWTQFCD